MIKPHETWQVQAMDITSLAGMFTVWNGVWNTKARYLCRDRAIRYSPLPPSCGFPTDREKVAASPVTGYFPTREEAEALLVELTQKASEP